jgi:hypothetical protein
MTGLEQLPASFISGSTTGSAFANIAAPTIVTGSNP